MSLMMSDPFAGFERQTQHPWGARQRPRQIPMSAVRRGDQVIATFDLPGISQDDVDITVERNVVTLRAERRPAFQDGDEVIIDERPYGVFSRQFFIGDSLDRDKMTAEYMNGELRLTIPVSEKAKPRKIPLRAGDQEPRTVTASSAGEGGTS